MLVEAEDMKDILRLSNGLEQGASKKGSLKRRRLSRMLYRVHGERLRAVSSESLTSVTAGKTN